jgi:PAS domain S-box-containing protein
MASGSGNPKSRIISWILLPVLGVGVGISLLTIAVTTPPLVSFIRNHFEANLKHAARTGLTICETNFNYLLELRLEDDHEMEAALRQEALEEIKALARVFPGCQMLVIDRDSAILAASGSPTEDRIDPLPGIGDAEAIIEHSLWGAPVIASARRFPFWGWTIVSYIEKSDYLYPIRLAQGMVAAGTIGLLACVILTLVLAFRRLVDRPLQRLVKATEDVAKGELQPIGINRQDEIGQLVAAFNSMIASLSYQGLQVDQLLDDLRGSEERFRTLFEYAPLGIGLFGNDGRLLDCNDAMLHLLAVGKQDAGTISLGRIVDRSDALEAETVQDRAGTGTQRIESRLRRQDGTTLDVKLTVSRIALGSDPMTMVITEDITQQKQLENRLRQSQKMEAVGVLAGGIAHDFNNILTPIMGLTEILIEDTPANDPRQVHQQGVLRAAHRAKDLVQQILTFSRQQEQEMIPLRLQSILKEVVKLAGSTLPSILTITTRIQPDCRPVMADPTQIHQVAMNLVTNAYHAMFDSGGELTIELKETELPDRADSMLAKSGRYACLRVSDTGTGIDPRVIDRIFEPYFTTKDKTKGTGLGLSVVHGIIRKFGGDILVSSRLGEGSVFSVYLPVMQQPVDVVTADPEGDVIPGRGERILLVDDEAPILDIQRQMLERLGYRVDTRLSSLDALEAFKAAPNRYDLVITDLTMPNLTGDRLASTLLEIRPRLPIIVCTGFSERLAPEAADAMGVRGYLMKPVVRSDLAQVVRAALES